MMSSSNGYRGLRCGAQMQVVVRMEEGDERDGEKWGLKSGRLGNFVDEGRFLCDERQDGEAFAKLG